MCGFTGWYNPKENLLKKKKIIKKMNKTLKYRGPDQTGYYYDKNLLLGHQRLSIIDLKNGKQPMNYKNYTIVYNGEIYNTCELRDDLIEKGYISDKKLKNFETNKDINTKNVTIIVTYGLNDEGTAYEYQYQINGIK